MSPRGRCVLCQLAAAAALLGATAVAAAQVRPPPVLPAPGPTADTAPDPVPIRRVLVPAERVAAEWNRLRGGTFVQMPRAELEERVRNAARAAAAQKHPPQLLEARYRAVLGGAALTGTGRLTVTNPAGTLGLLPLQPFTLALSSARLGKESAAVADIDGKGPNLVVDAPGVQVLELEWSARGEMTPGGTRFDLRVPACVLCSLELELPADRSVVLSRENSLLSGPGPAAAPDRRVWRIDCAGTSELDFLVRRETPPGLPAARFFTRLQTRQVLSPGLAETDFDLAVETAGGAVQVLDFEIPPGLRPVSVTARNVALASWDVRPSAQAGVPGGLSVRLQEPFHGSVLMLHVHGVAALSPTGAWTCPGLALSGATLLGESVTLSVGPELRLAEWSAGDFELLRTVRDADGRQTLTLRAGLRKVDGQGVRIRPSARLRTTGPELETRQLLWWQAGGARPSLTALLTYELRRGRLYRLPVVLPDGWQVDQLALDRPGLLRGWAVQPGPDGAALLTVELAGALEAPGTVQVTLALRPTSGAPTAGEVVESTQAFPVLVTLGAVLTQGVLGVSVAPPFQAEARSSRPPSAPDAERDDAAHEPGERPDGGRAAATRTPPWGATPPDLFYSYQNQPVTGTLALRPRRSRTRARCVTEVVLDRRRPRVSARLLLRPEAGGLDTFDLYTEGPVPAAWEWKDETGGNPVLAVERLPLPDGLDRGTAWRFTLARIVREPMSLETSFDLAGQEQAVRLASGLGLVTADTTLGRLSRMAADASVWREGGGASRVTVPLVSVLSADRMEGETRVYLSDAGPVRLETTGLFEDAAETSGQAPAPWRVLRYGHPPVRLLAHFQPVAEMPPVPVPAEQSLFETYVEPGGRLLHRFRFRLTGGDRSDISVRLPAEAAVLGARVDGHWSAFPPAVTDGADCAVRLPTAAGATNHEYELLYASAGPGGAFGSRLEVRRPELPVPALAARRVWRLPPELSPLDPSACRRAMLSRADATDPLLGELANWTAWEPVAGHEDEAAFTVVRPAALYALSWPAACLVLLLAWAFRRQPRRLRYAFLLGGLAAGALLVLWLPAGLRPLAVPPSAALAVVAVAWYLRRAAGAAFARPVVTAATAALLVLGLPCVAAAPDAFVVWLLPGLPGHPDEQSALVPPELLDALARQPAGALPGAVLLSAVYEGTGFGEGAMFTATFEVRCLRDEPVVVPIALGGVELQEATLDKAPAHPVALPAPQTGYAVTVRGRGEHVVRLRFAIPSSEQDGPGLRFNIPELVRSRLRLTLPAGVAAPQVVFGRGSQVVTAGPADTRVDAELGRVNTVAVRWHDTRPAPAAVGVHERYFWDVQPASVHLYALLTYTPGQGPLSAVALKLPPDADVRRVEASSAGGGSLVRLRDWDVSEEGGGRVLRLQLYAVAAGPVQVFVELVSRRPPGPVTTLALPVPVGARPVESALAYRIEAARTTVEARGVTGVEPDAFYGPWQTAGIEDPGPPERAFTFRRSPGNEPSVVLRLRPDTGGVRYSLGTAWRLTSGQAQLAARARVRATGDVLGVLDWQVPPEVQVTGVTGPDVLSWSRTGSSLQVWLRQSTAETSLEVAGWLPLAGRPFVAFRLPPLRLPGATLDSGMVRVSVDRDLTLFPGTLRNLWALPSPRVGERVRAYACAGEDYGGEFVVSPAAADAMVRTLTAVEVRDGRLVLDATVDFEVRQGELRRADVRLAGWEGADVQLQASRVAGRRESRGEPGVRTWSLDLEPGVTGHYQVRLTASQALEGAGEVLLPDVGTVAGRPAEQWLVVAGPELLVEDSRGLDRAPDPSAAVRGRWPGWAERLRRVAGSAWKVNAADWRLRVRPRAALPGAQPVRVFLAEQSARVENGRSWLHRATYLLYHEAGAELRVTLPDGADPVRVTLDGRPVTPARPAPGRLWLPLAAGNAVRELGLEWTFAHGSEQLDRPDLTPPVLDAVGSGVPAVWSVDAPAGYQLDYHSRDAVPVPQVDLLLRRADALLRLIDAVSRQPTHRPNEGVLGPLAALEDAFFRTLQEAGAEPETRAEGPQRQEWARLREAHESLARERHFDRPGASAENGAPAASESSGTGRGALLRGWATRPAWSPGEGTTVPRLLLRDDRAEAWRRALERTALGAFLLLAAWFVQYFPRLVAVGYHLWPEALALAGAAALVWRAPVWITAGAVGIGIAVRLGMLVRALALLWRQRADAAAEPAAAPPAGA